MKADNDELAVTPRAKGFSLREFMGMVTIALLGVGLVLTALKLKKTQADLKRLQSEVGYLKATEPGQIAASRVPCHDQLTYQFRVRVPSANFRIAYSSLWPMSSTTPKWFGAVAVPAGESVVTVKIHEDQRDHRWKIAALVGSAKMTNRMSTVLPAEHKEVFRGSHQVVSQGVGRETYVREQDASIRLLDERWLVGEGALLLYGDSGPKRDQIGIYAELQPDEGPL